MRFDGQNNRVLVIDGAGIDALISVDLDSGARTIISNGVVPDAINAFTNPFGVAVDSLNNRALLTDASLDALVAVDLTDGQRVFLSR